MASSDTPKMFQSRSGFSLPRDGVVTRSWSTVRTFQSRSGFSLRRDVKHVFVVGLENPVSIPV
ncbi:hypothetical protein BRC95_01380, partial [Halobacteriales archaeon QS_5_68_33]